MNSVARFMAMAAVLLVCAVGARAAVTIETVLVGNPGNTGENSGECVPQGYGPCRTCGAVNYVYRIGKFEITAGQYAAFLNAVAKTDPYGLYNASMNSSSAGCQITQNGTDGSFTYDFSGGTVEAPGSTAANWENRPVNYVSWGDAARFCNWLHNGKPEGTLTGDPAQDVGLTEDGSYYLNGAMNDPALLALVRQPDAKWVIPSEDEWYKAAYHKNDGATGNYFEFPTSSDSVPSNDLVEPDPGNNANFYQSGDCIGSPYWRTVVGEFENSDSPYGAFDQAGNVWEWNEAVINSSIRGLRGGSWNGVAGGADVRQLRAGVRSPTTGTANPAHEGSTHAFRVAYFADCNRNGILDECDLDCGTAGGPCDVPGCGQSVDRNGNGVPDECAPDAPTLSEWGVVAMTLLVLTAGTVVFARRRVVSCVAG